MWGKRENHSLERTQAPCKWQVNCWQLTKQAVIKWRISVQKADGQLAMREEDKGAACCWVQYEESSQFIFFPFHSYMQMMMWWCFKQRLGHHLFVCFLQVSHYNGFVWPCLVVKKKEEEKRHKSREVVAHTDIPICVGWIDRWDLNTGAEWWCQRLLNSYTDDADSLFPLSVSHYLITQLDSKNVCTWNTDKSNLFSRITAVLNFHMLL